MAKELLTGQEATRKAEREGWYNCAARRWDANKEGQLQYLGGRRDNESQSEGKFPSRLTLPRRASAT